MEPVEEYQILFNITSGREDFFTENEWEYEDMMDDLTKEGALEDISQCVKKTYIWDDEIEQYIEDDVEILYDNILEETRQRKTESKDRFNKAELQAVKQSIDTALDDLQLTSSGTTGDYEDKSLRDELRNTSNFVGRYIGRMTENKMLEDGLDLSKIYSIQNYADVMTDKVIADMKYNERDKITIDDIINVIDDNINDTDIFSILCAEEREIYDKYFNEETIDELKDLWDNQSYAESQFIDMVKDRVQKNGYTVYDEYNESKKVTESKKLTEGKYEDTLETNISVKVLDYFTNTLGFDEDEAVDYYDTEVKSDKDKIEVEVRAELSYDDFNVLIPKLNRIIQTYDKEAYFDMVESGIARAVIDKNAYNRDKKKIISADKERYAKEVEEESKKTEAVELKPDGGDKTNYFMFYTSNNGTYKDNTADNIAQYGKEHLDGLKDLSLEEIKDKHIYWGTETGFNAFYNGDTYVLFDDIEKLPEDMKKDAYENCKGYDKKIEAVEDKLQSYMNRMSYETKTIDDVKAIVKEMVKDDELDDKDLDWLFGHSVQPVLKERFNVDVPYEAEKQNMGTYEYIMRVYADDETMPHSYVESSESTNFGWKNNATMVYGKLYDGNYFTYVPENSSLEIYNEEITDKYIASAYGYQSDEEYSDDKYYDDFNKKYNITSKYDKDTIIAIEQELDKQYLDENKKTEGYSLGDDKDSFDIYEHTCKVLDMIGQALEEYGWTFANYKFTSKDGRIVTLDTSQDNVDCLYIESPNTILSSLANRYSGRYTDTGDDHYVICYIGIRDEEAKARDIASDIDRYSKLDESKKVKTEVVNKKKIKTEGSNKVDRANALLDLFNELYDGLGDMYAESEWAEVLADDYNIDSEDMEDAEVIITALNKMDDNAFRSEVDNYIYGLFENDGIDYLKDTLHVYPRNLKHIIQCLNTIKPYASEPDKIDNVIEELQGVNMDLRTTAEEFQRYLHDNYKPWTVLGSTSGPRTYVNLFEVPTEYDIVGADYFNYANRPSDMLENIGYGWKQDGDKIVADLIGYTHSVKVGDKYAVAVYDQAPVKYGYSAVIDSSNKDAKFKEMAKTLMATAKEIKEKYKLGESKTTKTEAKRSNKQLDYKLDGFKGVTISVVDKKNGINTEKYIKFYSMEFGIDEYEFKDSIVDGIKDILTDIYEFSDAYYDDVFTADEITKVAEDITQDVLHLYNDLPEENIDREKGYANLNNSKSITEAVDTEEKAKEVKEKVEQDIQNQGTENLVDTTEELYDKLKKEIYAYAKQQGLDLEKLRKQGIELETIADTIDNVVGDMVSKTVIEYMDTTGKNIMWDFNISNNDIQVIIQ